MNNKNILRTIAIVILIPVVIFIFYLFFMYHKINPGIQGLSNYKVGIFYCTMNDEVPTLVNMAKTRLKTKAYEVRTVVPYPKDAAELNERLKEENGDLDKIILERINTDVAKYEYIIMATPVVNNKPCPQLQKFVFENQSKLENKPISLIILYKNGESFKDTHLFFIHNIRATWKSNYITEIKDPKKQNYEFDLWLNSMQFKRAEFK